MLAILALSAAFLAPLTARRSSNAHNDRATRLVLNDIQLLATRAMHIITQAPAEPSKTAIPYTPYGGFDRVFKATKKIS